MLTRFQNRTEAGRALARKLMNYSDRPDVLVLALPRGGVPVAYEVAKALNAPLDIFVVRKLGVPGNEELAMGAVASGGLRVLNEGLIRNVGISEAAIELVTARELRELERRERFYRGRRPALDVRGRTVILVDDGLATGATMQAAVKALRLQKPAEIIVSAPVAARRTCEEFRRRGSALCVCAQTPEPFDGVGQWYRDFSQTTDEEVIELLRRANDKQALNVA
ncbi:MAG TPA: phosphoribosyltransferase [Pyrinomonadaceae bacterium]|nr:phosphoribosyltransferase [Pyrinomonadaceae bacterium]